MKISFWAHKKTPLCRGSYRTGVVKQRFSNYLNILCLTKSLYHKSKLPTFFFTAGTKINKNNVKRLKALLKKGEPLPYKNLATIFAEHATDHEESEDSLCNKSIKKGLLAFGEYLEEKKVIMPLKIDVIDFVLKNQSKKPDVLCWYFWGCMKFMMFCHAHSDDIFDGIFKNTDVYREVKFLSAVIFDYDYTGFKSDEEDE